MTDRELLELAAKAAGYEGDFSPPYEIKIGHDWFEWNPLEYNGDALQIAVTLGMTLSFDGGVAEASSKLHGAKEPFYERSKDKSDAARRAIVRAAAEIGKAMP